VKSSRIRQLIAFSSYPIRRAGSRKPDCPFIDQRKRRLLGKVGLESPFSPVRFEKRNSRIGGLFARISMNCGESSHQSRLRGGEEDIRTLSTLLNDLNGGVSVSYTGSMSSENLKTAPLPRSRAKQCGWVIPGKGEWSASLWLEVVTLECCSRPSWLALTACSSAQSDYRTVLLECRNW
jgi:hypothetical protein